MNQTIKKVTEDIEYFRYNTAIAAIMEFVNLLRDTSESSAQRQTTQESEISADKSLWTECLSTLAKLLAPFAPHMTEEVWVNVLQKPFSVHLAKWPTFDPKLVAEEEVIIPVQINGKLRATLKIDSLISTDKKKVIDLAKNNEKIQKWLEAKEIKKEIFVPGKLVNLVI
jgi:leucyl-tRNA synthetase